MLHEPELLLLDEPTAGVDPSARRDFWDEIHKLAGEGVTVLVSTHYMDEAERCHRLGYIAYGKLLARGTPAELVEQSGFSTWNVQGGDTHELADKLEGLPGVDLVTRFGMSLHISGTDCAALDAAVRPFQQDNKFEWTRSKPVLEEIFIHLMRQSADNFS
jgi:ABC-2 type transport system ATP-binding protein